MRVIFVQYLTVGVIKRGQTALLTLCGGDAQSLLLRTVPLQSWILQILDIHIAQ